MNIAHMIAWKAASALDHAMPRSSEASQTSAENAFIQILRDFPRRAAPGHPAVAEEQPDAKVPDRKDGRSKSPSNVLNAETEEQDAGQSALAPLSPDSSSSAAAPALPAQAFAFHQVVPSGRDQERADRPVGSSTTAAAGHGAAPESTEQTVAEELSRSHPRLTVLERQTHFAPLGQMSGNRATVASPPPDTSAVQGKANTDAPHVLPRHPDPVTGLGRGQPHEQASGEDHSGTDRTATVLRSADRSETSPDHARNATERAHSPDAAQKAEPKPRPEPGMSALPTVPTGQLSRIATSIDALGASLDGAASKQVLSGAAPSGPEANTGPLRTLSLQLEPVKLGMVHIELRLSQGELSVTLRASREETARMLEHDRQTLTEILRSTGHDPETLTIQAIQTDRSMSTSEAQPLSMRGGGPQASLGNNAQSSGQQQDQPAHSHSQSGHGQSQEGAKGNAQSSGDGRRGDLYV